MFTTPRLITAYSKKMLNWLIFKYYGRFSYNYYDTNADLTVKGFSFTKGFWNDKIVQMKRNALMKTLKNKINLKIK